MISALRPRSRTDHHVMRNAFLRFVAIAGLMMITVIGGTVVTKAVFTYHGLGRLLLQRRKVVVARQETTDEGVRKTNSPCVAVRSGA